MKSRSLAALLAFVCIGSTGLTQALDATPEAKKAREELCKQVLCRPPTMVRLMLKDGRVMEVPFEDVSPIVLPNGWVTILPGEDVQIAFEMDGEVIRNHRAVQPSKDSKNTLSFRFTQDAKTGDSLLVVNSTLDHAIKFDLGMMLPESDRILKTSSCPVSGGKSSYEHWPHPIFQFIAARFRVLPAGSPTRCE